MKGVRASTWKTRDIGIRGKIPTDLNFAYTGNQIQFIDAVKYLQQSLGTLAISLTSSEKESIYKECERYLLKNKVFSTRFQMLSQTDREWVLEYLSSSKGTIPYELITDFDSLNITPGKDFFKIHQFYSNIKDLVLFKEEYENVKKFYNLLKLSNLGKLNQIYNFQDTIILCEIFEQRADLFKEIFKFNPRKCNSASSFSGCVHRNKSKCCIALPTDANYVREHLKKL